MLINKKEQEIYGKLFDITSSNYDSKYGNLKGNRRSFLISVDMKPNQADLSLLDEVPASEFLEAAYIAILKRLPEPEVEEE